MKPSGFVWRVERDISAAWAMRAVKMAMAKTRESQRINAGSDWETIRIFTVADIISGSRLDRNTKSFPKA